MSRPDTWTTRICTSIEPPAYDEFPHSTRMLALAHLDLRGRTPELDQVLEPAVAPTSVDPHQRSLRRAAMHYRAMRRAYEALKLEVAQASLNGPFSNATLRDVVADQQLDMHLSCLEDVLLFAVERAEK